MKNLILSLALAVVVTLGLSSCATTSETPPITQEQLDKTAVLLKGSVRAGLLLVIDKNGPNGQAYVCAVGEALNVVLDGSDYTPGALEASLTKLPVKELKKAEAQLAISTVLTAYEIYYGDYVKGKIGSNATAYTLLSAVRDGVTGACSLSGG